MPIENVIHRKLGKLGEYIQKLEPIQKFPFKEYVGNYFTKHTAERLIELIVEGAVDINGLIITSLGEPPPKDYYNSFVLMGRLKILPEALVKKLAPTAGLRNRLAHEYEEIKDRIVYENVKSIPVLYRRYISSISDYLRKETERLDRG